MEPGYQVVPIDPFKVDPLKFVLVEIGIDRTFKRNGGIFEFN